MPSSTAKGFTLIELLVVVSIIGLLSSIVMTSLTSTKTKANDTKRMTDIHAIQTALELYRTDYPTYPVTTTWSSKCASWPDQGSGTVIPGLVGKYLPKMPNDPDMNAAASTCCYLYYSNGQDYKFLIHNCPTSNVCYGSGEATGGFSDPVRPTWACAAYTVGATAW